jgi:helix-turn-helix protein
VSTVSPLAKSTDFENLWSVEQVAVYLGVPVQTLYSWRKRRIGPPCGRVGKHLRYEPRAVREWFVDQTAA